MPKNIYPYSTRNCIQCQVEYQPTHKEQKYCSLGCANKNRRYVKKYYNKNCSFCQKEFIVNSHNKKQKFCSKSCSAKNTNKKYPIKRNRMKPVQSSMRYRKKLRKHVTHKLEHPDILGQYSIIFFCQCLHCKKIFFSKHKKRYCSEHYNYTNRNNKTKYRFSKNIIENNQHLFDMSMIEKYGYYHSIDNPTGVTKDHRVSVWESIQNDYDPYYITHPLNCELMLFSDNSSKNEKSSITYDDLVKSVNNYEFGESYGIRIHPC